MKGIICKNSQDLAKSIHECQKTQHKRYTLRPFNRYDHEKSMWWLIPSTEYPAYRYGKYFVCENGDGTYSVGLHVEKGLEKAVEHKRELMMDDTWTWHCFVKALKNGDIENILRDINRKVDGKVGIEIRVEIPDLKETWEYELQGERFIKKGIEKEVDIKKIPGNIINTPKIEWYWVDFYITFTFQKCNQDNNGHELSDYEIVKNLLESLETWVR
ncbi:hypothetical protein [Neobacillus fumarioli]|uniref:hypothetical protein n=1 Tax=Neobacillus fumarioli TaxID=105229 RepID=UPI000835C385|nr:hypothetical protein [Neobacillus fumarioli]